MNLIKKFNNIFYKKQKRVAVFIVNYNMNERADALYEYLSVNETWPHDIYLIDNGSDITIPSKYTNVSINKNVQTTNEWLKGLEASDRKLFQYFAYMFVITSAEFTPSSKKPITSMIRKLIEDENAVGVHASLTKDSTTSWTHLIHRPGHTGFRETHFIDNICSLYRADWFNSIGRFDANLIFAWGIDLETGYIARKQERTLWIDEDIQVRKETNIAYKMNRMHMKATDRSKLAKKNMDDILSAKYGKNYMWKMLNRFITKDMI